MKSNQNGLSRLKSVHNLQLNIIKESIHDLKSPIGGISGYLELMDVCLNGTGEVDKMDRYRAQIVKGLEEINSIVSQVHEVAGEEVNSEDDDYLTEADICWVARDVCKKMRGVCSQKNIELECKDSAESLHLSVDLVLLKLMLINLINNALKYTVKPGKIIFEITKTEGEVSIQIKSVETTRSGKDIEQNFLKELSNSNGGQAVPALEGRPYYFGVDCIEEIHKSAEMIVDLENSFTVGIRFILPE